LRYTRELSSARSIGFYVIWVRISSSSSSLSLKPSFFFGSLLICDHFVDGLLVELDRHRGKWLTGRAGEAHLQKKQCERETKKSKVQ
jgi:hypothetical protein